MQSYKNKLMPTAAVDTETYYDKACSVKKLHPWHYVRHPDWDCYIVSIATDTGLIYSGAPDKAPWNEISGPEWTWVSHNKGFDETVLDRLKELNEIPHIGPSEWFCSADMCAYLGMPRNLKGASKIMLGVEMSKDVRDNMVGKRFKDLPLEKQEEMYEYAKKDAVVTLDLWSKYNSRWPAHERMLSEQTRQIGNRGVPLDVESLREQAKALKRQMMESENKIPWATAQNVEEEDGAKLLSTAALARECRKHGIEPPSSVAQDSEECTAWENKYGEQYPWVDAMRTYRRCNMLLKKIEAMLNRSREDGTMVFSMLYCGGHTLRWSGSGGVNMQNLPRAELLGADLRGAIRAKPGYKLVIADLSQIEPRCLAYFGGNTPFLDKLRDGLPLYEAYARVALNWTGGNLKKEDPNLYKLAKAMVLGLGYGCSAAKFSSVAKIMADLEVSDTESARYVAQFRRNNPHITNLWRKLDSFVARCVGKEAEIELPSGRKLLYRDVQAHNGLSGIICRQGAMMRVRLWGGYMTENLTQAFARDVFADCLLRIQAANINILWHVHDEVICLAKELEAEDTLARVLAILGTAPEWCSALPIAAEGSITNKYEK